MAGDAKWPRVIVHADMDAFFAAVEQLDNPELRGKALLIGGTGRRGVVSTASYEARPYGVGSAMSMVKARRLCPHALVMPPRMSRYAEVSRQVMDVFDDFSPDVEALSLDEAFLDLTGADKLFGSPTEIGTALKRAVKKATGGLTVSVGISVTKYVAKVASDFDKPDGLTLVPADQVEAFLHPLAIDRLWGVGKKSRPRLEALGLHTIGDVARTHPAQLERKLGKLGAHIAHLSRGIDPRPVVGDRTAKSVGSERTLAEDIRGMDAIMRHLIPAADEIAQRLRKKDRKARGVRVKLKTPDFKLHTRQSTLSRPTDSAHDLLAAAELLLDAFDLSRPVRLVGMAAYDLLEPGTPMQGDLFATEVVQQRSRLDQTVDSVQDRFGSAAIRRASDLE